MFGPWDHSDSSESGLPFGVQRETAVFLNKYKIMFGPWNHSDSSESGLPIKKPGSVKIRQ